MNHEQKNNIITISSGSKSSGKTFLASTLAWALGFCLRKVLFFDADTGAENIAYQLGLKHSDLYKNMLKGQEGINNAVCFFPKLKFDVIFSDSHAYLLNNYPIGRAQILLRDLQNFDYIYDTIIIDCSSENKKIKNMFVQAAQKNILVVLPDRQGLSQAYKELEQITKQAFEKTPDVQVVINMAESIEDGERFFTALSNAAKEHLSIDISLLGVICQDGYIRDCLQSKKGLFERYPKSKTMKTIMQIAAKLQEEN